MDLPEFFIAVFYGINDVIWYMDKLHLWNNSNIKGRVKWLGKKWL